MNKKYYLLIFFILLCGLVLRLYHIEFGLPHSFYADEPEFAEPAIKYTYEIRNIVKNNDYYKLFPISFVYGTFTAYLFTFATMAFSKFNNLLGIGFDKTTLYVFMRSLNAVLSLLVVLSAAALSFKLSKKRLIFFTVLILGALNWKLIVHAHYLNADLIQTILLMLSYLLLFYYYKRGPDNKFTVLTGIFFGLAFGTKITALMSLPLFYYIFWQKKDYVGALGFSLVAGIAFMVSNPFSLILSERFALRILEMFSHEGGLVLDSADPTFYKYFLALGFITTPLVLLSSITGAIKSLKSKVEYPFHYFLLGNIIIYLLFFTLQSRRVDRWLLPILPIVLIYAGIGVDLLFEKIKNKVVLSFTLLLLAGSYLYFPVLLLVQFQRYTPKAAAYLWMRNNLDKTKRVFAYTEEGLDPLNKLPTSKVVKLPVYSTEGAQFYSPVNLQHYHYVVISSRPLQNYKRPSVRQTYPFYYEKWKDFEDKLANPEQFKLINQFVLPKPNLIPLSDVFVYENLGEVKVPPPELINNP